MLTRNMVRLFAVVGVSLAALACGGDDGNGDTNGPPETDGTAEADDGADEQPANGEQVDGLVPVSVTMSSTTAANFWPWKIGMDVGLFEPYGLELTDMVLAAGGGGSPIRNVLTGQVTMGDIATGATIEAYLAGAPVVVVGGSAQNGAGLAFGTRSGNTDVLT